VRGAFDPPFVVVWGASGKGIIADRVNEDAV
jgi:hypothetical protein